MRSLILLSTALISGCSSLPPFPQVNQCAYSLKFNKFRCCDSEIRKCFNLRRDDTSMEAAQCLSADDYKKASEWIETVKQIAEKHCQ